MTADDTAAAAPQGATMDESQVEQLIEKMGVVARSSEVDSEAAIVAAIAMQIIRSVQAERDEARAALAEAEDGRTQAWIAYREQVDWKCAALDARNRAESALAAMTALAERRGEALAGMVQSYDILRAACEPITAGVISRYFYGEIRRARAALSEPPAGEAQGDG